MPRYKKVDYNKIASMILKVASMRGEPIKLKDMVDDMCRKMSLNIDTHRVQWALGDKVVEKVEDRSGVRAISTWVRP